MWQKQTLGRPGHRKAIVTSGRQRYHFAERRRHCAALIQTDSRSTSVFHVSIGKTDVMLLNVTPDAFHDANSLTGNAVHISAPMPTCKSALGNQSIV